eukprot:m.260430 g.260430  ORF g.260430 m.260430 type:complete len:119 (-) comp23574_c0_seq1:59-415(-)
MILLITTIVITPDDHNFLHRYFYRPASIAAMSADQTALIEEEPCAPPAATAIPADRNLSVRAARFEQTAARLTERAAQHRSRMNWLACVLCPCLALIAPCVPGTCRCKCLCCEYSNMG